MKNKSCLTLLVFLFFLSPCYLGAQSLATNRTKAEGRYNLEKIFADRQRKIFNITSWAGHQVSELLSKLGSYTRKNELLNGMVVYIFENNFSGSGGTREEGYVVTDPFGNILAQKDAKDNTYSFNFTDYYEFYADKDNRIIHVKTGTR